MRTVRIGNVNLGEGMPKICVPITGVTESEILESASRVKAAGADICEWRADWFETLNDENALARVLKGMNEALETVPVLFTIRTRLEGGQADIAPEAYARLNACAAKNGAAMVDVELSMPGSEKLIAQLHALGVPVIASAHDFEKTPDSEEILAKIRRMREAGADVAKVAVMPQSVQDVLRLLAVTSEAAQGDTPIVTMAMGRLGVISRLSGETFGSAMTFGAAGAVSAPGQIDAKLLRSVLEALHGA